MNVVVVYESMFGNARLVADAIVAGLRTQHTVAQYRVDQAPRAFGPDVDLLLIGAPTHAHGLSTPESRAEAVVWSEEPARELSLEPNVTQIGVREWMAELPSLPAMSSAFDTRADALRFFAGAASSSITRRIKRRGISPVLPPESFIVTKNNELKPNELERARSWGERLAEILSASRLRDGDSLASNG